MSRGQYKKGLERENWTETGKKQVEKEVKKWNDEFLRDGGDCLVGFESPLLPKSKPSGKNSGTRQICDRDQSIVLVLKLRTAQERKGVIEDSYLREEWGSVILASCVVMHDVGFHVLGKFYMCMHTCPWSSTRTWHDTPIYTDIICSFFYNVYMYSICRILTWSGTPSNF